MKLSSVKDTVAKYAETISSILDVAVTVVDDELNRIGDTYHYPDELIPVRTNSILGAAVATGKPIATRVRDSEICRSCDNFPNCGLNSLIAAPIYFYDQIVGGFCLIIPPAREALLENAQTSIDFLENMADLLSEKMKSAEQLERIEHAYRERETIMNVIEDALVSTDDMGNIQYYNKHFDFFFGGNGNVINKNISNVIMLPVIRNMLQEQYYADEELIYYKNPERDAFFYGFVCCHPRAHAGDSGLLFTFRSINSLNALINKISNHRSEIDFDWVGYHQGAGADQLVRQAKQLAITDEILLIQGENGAGHSALAKAIHNFSNRSHEYYVQVNCETLSPEELEHDIFGYDAGRNQLASIGKMRLAHKGTILFENINHMPLYLQERVARFIRTRKIGITTKEELYIDVRMIFTSNGPLSELMENGYFSEALYYRISKNTLTIPPLGSRTKEQLLGLLQKNFAFLTEKYHKPSLQMEPEAMELLAQYPWPGNLEQLCSALDKLVCTARGSVTQEQVKTLRLPGQDTRLKSIDELEEEQIARMLQEGYRKEEIAKVLNISRATLYRRLKGYFNIQEMKRSNYD